jgi:hypothetical protein
MSEPLETIPRDEIAKVLNEVRELLRAEIKADLFSLRGIAASAQIYTVECIARKLDISLETRKQEVAP